MFRSISIAVAAAAVLAAGGPTAGGGQAPRSALRPPAANPPPQGEGEGGPPDRPPFLVSADRCVLGDPLPNGADDSLDLLRIRAGCPQDQLPGLGLRVGPERHVRVLPLEIPHYVVEHAFRCQAVVQLADDVSLAAAKVSHLDVVVDGAQLMRNA